MTAAQPASASALFPLFGGISVIFCGWLNDRLARAGRAVIMLIGLSLTTLLLLAIGSGVIPASQTMAVSLVTMVAFLIMGPYSFLAGAISLDFGGKQGSGTASGLIDGVGYVGGVISGDTMARISVRYGWGGVHRIGCDCVSLQHRSRRFPAARTATVIDY
jgi:OPA family glycerol-3-phosphate transporter-like MFS transporter